MPLPASTGCWHPWLVAIPLPSLVLGLWPYPSCLCLHLHKASSGVFEASPLLLSTFVLEFRTHPNPEGFHLKILNCLHPQNPYFQLRSHSEVVGGPEFGGVAIQPLQPSSRKASCVLSLPMLITSTLLVREQNSSGKLAGGEGAGAHSWSTGSRDLLSWPHVSLHPSPGVNPHPPGTWGSKPPTRVWRFLACPHLFLCRSRGAWTPLPAAPTSRSRRGAVTAGSLCHCSLSFLRQESGGGWRSTGRGLPEPSWPKGAPASPVICVYARRAPPDTVKGARMRPGEGRTEHRDTAPEPTGYAAGAPVGPGCPPGSIH